MTLIHKQQLTIKDTQTLILPFNSEILSVAQQKGALCIWYQFDPEFRKDQGDEEVRIYIIGTGHPIPDPIGCFIGTVVMIGNPFVWHVFRD